MSETDRASARFGGAPVPEIKEERLCRL